MSCVVQKNRKISIFLENIYNIHFKIKRPYYSSIFVCVHLCVFRVHRYRLKALQESQALLTVTEVRVLPHSGSSAACLYQNEMNMSSRAGECQWAMLFDTGLWRSGRMGSEVVKDVICQHDGSYCSLFLHFNRKGFVQLRSHPKQNTP